MAAGGTVTAPPCFAWPRLAGRELVAEGTLLRGSGPCSTGSLSEPWVLGGCPEQGGAGGSASALRCTGPRAERVSPVGLRSRRQRLTDTERPSVCVRGGPAAGARDVAACRGHTVLELCGWGKVLRGGLRGSLRARSPHFCVSRVRTGWVGRFLEGRVVGQVPWAG